MTSSPLIQTPHQLRTIIEEDGFKAYLLWESDGEAHSLTEDLLVPLLNEAGVVFGIRDDLVRVITTQDALRGKILVAEGIRPSRGKDGWTEYHQNAIPMPQDKAKEKKIDFHRLGWIHNINKGETVAVVHPPEPGTPGKTVKGDLVPAEPGKEVALKLGKSVLRDLDCPDKILATTDGNLRIEPGGLIEVEPLITVRGDVDYSTGDIDFVGTVVVTGDVRTGFSVKARGSIEIRGTVEDATIESGENVIVQKGFVGSGKGTITAVGNVRVQRIQNQSITSGDTITVEREAVCARLRANGKIASLNAAFVGCLLEAGTEIEVSSLGIGDQGQATARVGKRALVLERINANEKELHQLHKQLDDVKQGIYRSIRLELDNGPSVAECRAERSRLQALQRDLLIAQEACEHRRDALKSELNNTRMARIVVHDTLFSNVFVELNGIKKLIQSSVAGLILTENAGKIEEQSLE
jgi:uncharacterized protein (DUF342 family)